VPPVLRSYQHRAIDDARQARRSGHRRIILTAPTGSGKSVMASAMIARAVELGDRVLVIGHRKELISQFYVHLQRVGITPGIMRGDDERTDPSSPVQVGTVQTLVRRDLPRADLVVVDEAHRVPGASYEQVLGRYAKATVLGLTATPCRLDGKPLKEHFDAMVHSAGYSELIDAGAIVAPIVYAPKKAPDLSKVRTVAGDYHEGQLESAMMEVVGDVVTEWQKHAGGRQTVVFAVGIDHSRELVARFKEAGVRAAHLDGSTPDVERDQLLLDLATGAITVLCNVGVCTEGWDCPPVKCCVMARPTKSLTLWMQCAGRILRPYCSICRFPCAEHPSDVPVILDHAGNVDRHGLPHEDREWSLDGTAKRKTETRYRTCPACYAYVTGSPCPVCGHVAPVAHREVKKSDGVLERIDQAIQKEKSADPKRAYFDSQVDIARKRGFKPGYASAKYKEKYGDWPSWAWSQSVKADHFKDEEWKARISKHEREKAFWNERKSAPEHPAPEEPDDPMYFDVSDL
jgi:DNA repair protein RadD